MRIALLSFVAAAACVPSDPDLDPEDTSSEQNDPGDDPHGDQDPTTGAPDPTDPDPTDPDPTDPDPMDPATTGPLVDSGDDTTGTTGDDTTGTTGDDTTGDPMYVCGNAVLEPGEVCDDGKNDGSYGGCEPGCMNRGPHCGDGEVQAFEGCDDANTIETDGCTSQCAVIGCGDGIVAEGEECEGIGALTVSCASLGLEGDIAICMSKTCTYDKARCTGCGNGVLEPGELCDGADLGEAECTTQGFMEGKLRCNSTCDGFDTEQCTDFPLCGNGMLDPGEVCDGAPMLDTCESLGFGGGGVLGCNAACDALDTSTCFKGDNCGDGKINIGEMCDGLNVGDMTCESLGLGTGLLVCNATCGGYDLSGCFSGTSCGDDVVQAGELCDGLDLGGASCEGLGFAGGTLLCDAMCMTFDVEGCTTENLCGNDVIDAGEACDGLDLAGESCESLGLNGGVLACSPTCDFVTDGCTFATLCGNGVIDDGEACDGADLGGDSCESLGFGGGVLGCVATCGTFDLGFCEP